MDSSDACLTTAPWGLAMPYPKLGSYDCNKKFSTDGQPLKEIGKHPVSPESPNWSMPKEANAVSSSGAQPSDEIISAGHSTKYSEYRTIHSAVEAIVTKSRTVPPGKIKALAEKIVTAAKNKLGENYAGYLENILETCHSYSEVMRSILNDPILA